MGLIVSITDTGGALAGGSCSDPALLAAAWKDAQVEVMAGLPAESGRLTAMQANAAFWRMENVNYLEKREGESDDDFARRPKRVVFLTRKAVSTLARKLYSPVPSRTFRGPAAATALLKVAYAKGRADVALAEANRWAILNDVAAIQVHCTGDPGDPVRLYVYGGQEFAAFCTPDEPARPWCVVLISVEPAGVGRKRRVYTAWTADAIRYFKTKPIADLDTAGGTRAEFDRAEPNPYGMLPFAFFHNAPPLDRFWNGSGIGSPLRQTNQEIDRELSDLAQQIEAFSCPDFFIRNVASSFRYEKSPGRPQRLVSTSEALAGDNDQVPEAFYVQPQILVEGTWYDVEKLANACFNDLDVPLNAVRDGLGAPTSGLQVLAESIPLLDYLKERQPLAAGVDFELAATILRCVGAYHEAPAIAAAAGALALDAVWPEPSLPVPSPEADAQDQWELSMGLLSPIQALMRRRGLTRDQAIEQARQIAEDNKIWSGLFPDATKPQPPAEPGGAGGPSADPGGDVQDAGEADPNEDP